MTKVLVTGGAGFIGSHIVDRLVTLGYNVVVIDNLSTGFIEYVNENAIFYKNDIYDNQLFEIFKKEKPDYVIHHAASVKVSDSIKDPVRDAKVNILGTINLLECCRESDVKKIIYASSAAVYGEPEYLGIDEKHQISPKSFYGISKYVPEQYLDIYNYLYGLEYVVLRYSNVYGPRQLYSGDGGVISVLINKLLSKERPVVHGDGNQTRDFIYVQDVVDINLLALYKGKNDIINVGVGKFISINELLDLIQELSDHKITPFYTEERIGDIKKCYFDNTLAKTILGWTPKYSLEEGLRETIDYFQQKKKRSDQGELILSKE